jgi:adenylylsulfate kinase-like enzyme
VILVPIISPYRVSRRYARLKLKDSFYEIYFSDGLNIVSKIDVKGLYKKARKGKIENMIGFAPESPYEPPENPHLILSSLDGKPEESGRILFNFIHNSLN